MKDYEVMYKLTDLLIDYLGDYNKESFQITLYDVPNEKRVIDKIKTHIESVTKKYQFIILSPGAKYTNIKILDIDL